jgi:OOP family OmpA-OmpF porin
MYKSFIALAVLLGMQVIAQKQTSFNQWSIELNAGQNKAVRPFSEGYYTADPKTYFKINGLEHFDLGTRYMLSNTFGLKMDVAYDLIQSHSGTGSLDFKNKQYRVGFQGVSNIGRLMKFESFTSRIGLLVHGGIQVSLLEPQMGINKGRKEQDGGIMLGLTPQFKINNRFVITGDFTLINNLRQHFNWDGTYSAVSNNLTGMMYNTSIGLTCYLGKNEQHADWYLEVPNNNAKDEEARQRLNALEKNLKDTDKDGVPDYLDLQPDTVIGVAVDSKGRFIDTNKNGIPDEKENTIPVPSKPQQDENSDSKTALKNLMEYELNILYYENNRIDPDADSKKKLVFIVEYLKKYPNTKAHIIGYADNIGTLKSNTVLAERRAKKIQTIIESYGIESSRLQSDGNGIDPKFNTKANNAEPIARRVSIIIE